MTHAVVVPVHPAPLVGAAVVEVAVVVVVVVLAPKKDGSSFVNVDVSVNVAECVGVGASEWVRIHQALVLR